MFCTGETPSRQLLPAMRWLHRENGVRRWCIVGNDYVVQSGRAPGEQLIVGGLQKIRDGAPVMAAPPAAPTQAPKAP